MENILFLVLIAAIALVRLAMRAAEAKKNKEATRAAPAARPNPTPPRVATESDEQRIRKFFDALGLPANPSTEAPPSPPSPSAPARPRVKRAVLPVDPFPLPRILGAPSSPARSPVSSPQSPSNTEAPANIPAAALVRPRRTPRVEPAAPNFEVHDLTAARPPIAASRPPSSDGETLPASEGIVARLVTAEGLRDAIILREIFGEPRSMQPIAGDFAR